MIAYDKLEPGERELVKDLVHNTMVSRQGLIKQLMDGDNRDLNTECQYPDTGELTAQDYKDLYDRESIAARVVEVLPKESWKVQPSVYEDEDPDAETTFELAWKKAVKALRGQSFFQDEEGSPVWEALRRVDVLSGIGRFGVLFLGLDDGMDPSQPAAFHSDGPEDRQDAPGTANVEFEGKTKPEEKEPADGVLEDEDEPVAEAVEWDPKVKLLYVRTFDETQAQVTARETDRTSPRFGLPTMYLLSLEDPSDVAGEGTVLGTINAHWTRVIHVADNLGSSEVFGKPRMQTVYNRLLDLRKLYGGSAEMFWRGAFPGISVETHPQLGGDVEIDVTALREQMQDYMHGLQRYLALMGMSAKSLPPQVSDPASHIDKQIEAICILTGIPMRIFMGSERGELASSQDDTTWNERLEDRQRSYLTPRLIVPFVDRLILLGVLPEPAEGYSVDWPPLNKASELEKADVATKLTEAMSKYVGAGVDVLVEPLSFLTLILGLDEEDAKQIIEATEQHVADGGIEKPVSERDEMMADLDLAAKEKTVELIGKEPAFPPGGGKPDAFGKK